LETPKPTKLIKRILSISTETDSSDIVLDFFAGTSSTAHAVLGLNKEDKGNRKFIMVQLPEQCDEKTNVYRGGFKNIADIGKERIRRVIKKIEDEKKDNPGLFDNIDQDLGFKVFKLRPSNFKIWRGSSIENGEALEEQLDAFIDPVKPGSAEENMLYELLLKSGYDLISKVEQKTCGEAAYYVIENGEMVIALSSITEALVKDIITLKPRKVICLDKLFANNDQLKTNTVLQMKDAGVEFKTV